jgi:hypothetical protein
MKALINETERNTLLKEKIDYCMEHDVRICISVEDVRINLLNTIDVEDYKVNDDYLFISAGNFEFTIPFNNEMQVTYNQGQECFKFTYEDTEITLFTLE